MNYVNLKANTTANKMKTNVRMFVYLKVETGTSAISFLYSLLLDEMVLITVECPAL